MLKKLRRLVLIIAAPATLLFGIHEIAGVPISKGYETGFHWEVTQAGKHLILSDDTDGTITCRIVFRLASSGPAPTAKTSANVPLGVAVTPEGPGVERVEIVKALSANQEMFSWPAGKNIDITFGAPLTTSGVLDWYVYPDSKSFDSRERSQWRHGIFDATLILSLIMICGVTFEAVEKYGSKRETISAQRCIELLIANLDGDDPTETERMRTALGKILREGATVAEAFAPYKLSVSSRSALWFKTGLRFRQKLKFLIDELNSSMTALNKAK
jgi:hypothetical protein